MKENFDFEEEENENLEIIKKMVSSEIEVIRDALGVVAIYSGGMGKALIEYIKIHDTSDGDTRENL